jgi:hypothetical protein
VLGDVGDPEAVRVVAGEVPVDEVAGGGLVGDAPVLRSAGQALQAGLAHQQPHGFLADREAVAEGELGVHPPEPYTPRKSTWIWRIRSVSQA